MRQKMCIYKCMLNVYKHQQNRQTGSRNLMGPKTLPTIWGTYMKLVTKYQISAINSCWEKCAYMFNVYKNQLSQQTGSRNNVSRLLKEGQLYSGFLLAMIIFYNNVSQLLKEGQLYSGFLWAMKSSIMFFSCLKKASCMLVSS